MNCTKCHYPLWNLKERVCPECGQDFAPTQFKFVPRSVQFCCPHCQQHYYGTGVDGHLVPRVFDCVTCGRHLHMDEMVLLPAEGVTPEQTQLGSNPWIDKRRGGLLSRYFSTVGKSMVAPGDLIDQTPENSSTGRAILFGLISIFLSPLVNLAILFAMTALMAGMTGGGRGGGVWMFALGWVFAFCFAGMAIGILLWVFATHFILVITGGTAGGFRRTVQCVSYSSGPHILSAVPCVGQYLSPVAVIWQAICGTIMLKKAQRVSGLRAAVAMLFPPFIVLGGMLLLVAYGFFMSMSAAVTAAAVANAGAAQSIQQLRADTVAQSLNMAAVTQNGYPAHALELVKSNQVSASDLTLSSDPMASGAIVVGNATLGQIDGQAPARRDSALDAIIKAQPQGVVAHRLGDFVFTYHGMDRNTVSQQLWVFIAEPVAAPPGTQQGATQNPNQPVWWQVQQAYDTYFVGFPNGTTKAIPKVNFASELALQNQLRAQANLPALPDPATVTAGSPAVAPK